MTNTLRTVLLLAGIGAAVLVGRGVLETLARELKA